MLQRGGVNVCEGFDEGRMIAAQVGEDAVDTHAGRFLEQAPGGGGVSDVGHGGVFSKLA